MKICYAISQYHLAELTAQPKIIKLLAERTKDATVAIVSENSIFDVFDFHPDIITSHGYKLSVGMFLLNLFIRARHVVVLSETPEILGFFWSRVALFCLKRGVDKVFVTSEYIKAKLGINCEVARIGLDV
jgi:hypothetical protein